MNGPITRYHRCDRKKAKHRKAGSLPTFKQQVEKSRRTKASPRREKTNRKQTMEIVTSESPAVEIRNRPTISNNRQLFSRTGSSLKLQTSEMIHLLREIRKKTNRTLQKHVLPQETHRQHHWGMAKYQATRS